MQVDNSIITQVPDATESRIKHFISEHFEIEFNAEVTEQTDLFEQGLIDSFGFVELIKFLEKEFDIRFSDEELFSFQMNSLSNITDIVAKKLTQK